MASARLLVHGRMSHLGPGVHRKGGQRVVAAGGLTRSQGGWRGAPGPLPLARPGLWAGRGLPAGRWPCIGRLQDAARVKVCQQLALIHTNFPPSGFCRQHQLTTGQRAMWMPRHQGPTHLRFETHDDRKAQVCAQLGRSSLRAVNADEVQGLLLAGRPAAG